MKNKNKKITSIICKNKNLFEIKAKEYILAIPPYNINQILSNSKNNEIKNAFGNIDHFSDWSNKTNYLEYINVVFHWDTKFNLEKIWGFPSTSWGLGFIVLSDYMDFSDERSKIVISCIVTKNSKSEFTNKTPNQTNKKKDFIKEVLRQLKISYPKLPNPTYSIMEQNYHDGTKWIPLDTAFIKTKYGYINNKSSFKNLYNCGVHNGNNKYSFTSFESAINNAIALLHDLIPKSKKDYEIKNSIELLDIIIFFVIMIIIIILFVYLY